MFKNYDPRLVHSYRSYKIADLCRLYRAKKLHAQTIRGWINAGKLKAIREGNTILIYGAVFKQFLLDINSQHKRTLAFHEFRCGKCKAINAPVDHIIKTLAPGRNGCLLAVGTCSSCGHEIKRHYKREKEQEILKCFTVQHNELERLYDRSCSTSKTHLETAPKMPSSEPLKSQADLSNANTTPSTGKTHSKTQKSVNSTSKTQQLSFF